jgi:hypothetical protein
MYGLGRQTRLVFLLSPLALLLGACAPSGENDRGAEPSDSGTILAPTVVEVTAIYDAASDQHLFLTSADTVRAGWTTFRFTNASPALHFVFLDHLPGGRTSDELLSEVSPIFQEATDLIRAGRPDEASAQFANLPDWFNELVFRGGPGFTSPGLVTEATLFLEPGNYVLECYIKNADGVYHWNLGMHKDLHVTEEVTEAEPPRNPTLDITVTDSGLDVDGIPTPGEHLVAVHFQEEEPGLVGKDVHVARLATDTDLDEIVAWLDFNRPEGLVSTADDPAPATFVGGVHEMPLGNTAYFILTLEPGDYLWISEQPVGESAYRRFTVP